MVPSFNAYEKLVTLCRYSTFFLLYPSGISSEVGLIYTALPYIKVRYPVIHDTISMVFAFPVKCIDNGGIKSFGAIRLENVYLSDLTSEADQCLRNHMSYTFVLFHILTGVSQLNFYCIIIMSFNFLILSLNGLSIGGQVN